MLLPYHINGSFNKGTAERPFVSRHGTNQQINAVLDGNERCRGNMDMIWRKHKCVLLQYAIVIDVGFGAVYQYKQFWYSISSVHFKDVDTTPASPAPNLKRNIFPHTVF